MESIRLGPFELQAPIGKGGMGEVWRGLHVEQEQPVAVKVITAIQAREPSYLMAFRNEIQAVAGLNHPGIILVLDHGEVADAAAAASGGRLAAGSPYLVMELLTGGSLERIGPPTTWPGLQTLLLEQLSALAHAHARGVIHRDLKLGNVLLGAPGDDRPGYKIIDFGLATMGLREGGMPHELSAGTPAFEAPEQILGRWRDQGPWTDLYAFGCMAYALVAGRAPYEGQDLAQVLRCHLHVPMPPLLNQVPVPPGFEGWLKRLMAKHPNDRFRFAADAAYALATMPDGSLREPISRAAASSRAGHYRRPRADQVTRPVPRDEAALELERPLRRLDEMSATPFTEEAMPVLPPPIPRSWREAAPHTPIASARLLGAGLGLYGLRAIPLVDREPERDILWESLREIRRDGRARLWLLRGDAGTGKSRLVEWLTERTHEVCGALVLRALHSRIAGPADGLPRMMARFLGCVGLARAEVLRRTEFVLAEQGVDDEYEWHALTELMVPATPSERQAGARHIRLSKPRARYVLIQRMLQRLAGERPIIVWLDDVQWGEDALYFARFAMRQQSSMPVPVLFLLTAQTEALAEQQRALRLIGEILTQDGTGMLDIGPLPPQDHLSLVEGLLGLHSDLASQVASRTAGNPLFAVQLVGDWVQRGMLEVARDGFALREGVSAHLPDSLHEVWTDRVQRLLERHTHAAGLALELGAALGGDVDRLEWEAVCRHAGIVLRQSLLDALVEGRLARSVEGGFSFVHPMLRESLERDAVEGGRWGAHNRACATMLESLYGSEAPGVSERLGRHFVGAGELSRAVTLLLRGARERLDASEFLAAHGLLNTREAALTALQSGDFDPRWGEGWVLRAQIHHLQGQFPDAREWAEKGEAAASRYGWRAIRPRALTALGYNAQQRGELGLAEVLYQRARSEYEGLGDQEGVAGCLHGLGEVARLRGDSERAHDLNRQAHDLFERLGDQLGVSNCLRGLGVVAQQRRDLARATELYRRALEQYEALDYPYGQATCLNDLAEVARWRGDLHEAEDGYRKALAIYETIGSGDGVITQLNLGLVLLHRGRYGEARPLLQAGAEACHRLGRLGFLGAVNAALMPCAAWAEDWEAFDEHCEQASSLLGVTAMVDADIAWPARLAAELALGAKERDRAQTAAALALAQYRSLGDHQAVREIEQALAN